MQAVHSGEVLYPFQTGNVLSKLTQRTWGSLQAQENITCGNLQSHFVPGPRVQLTTQGGGLNLEASHGLTPEDCGPKNPYETLCRIN